MTNTNDILKIDTPENVTFDYDVAGIGSRFLAALADSLLIGFCEALLFGGLLLLASLALDTSIFENEFFGWALAIAGIISFLIFWGYYIFFEILWNGQTPGKRWVGLRVIRMDGTPITASEAVIRNLVRIIDLLPSGYGVGVVTMFISANSRRLGDLAAGTLVVHDREVGRADLGAIPAAMVNTWVSNSDVPEGFPVEKLSQYELQIIEEFLSRRRELSNRLPLAQHILTSILTRLEIPRETVPLNKAEEILAAIYKVTHVDKKE